jgi:hypothetical protein
MKKPNIIRRLGMRVLLWFLGNEQQSTTCELNRVIYERSSDGRQLARFSHPQVEVGAYTPMGLGVSVIFCLSSRRPCAHRKILQHRGWCAVCVWRTPG